MKGFRTTLFNIVAAAVPILEASGVTNHLPEKYLLGYILAMAAANIFLRYLTTTPIGKSS